MTTVVGDWSPVAQERHELGEGARSAGGVDAGVDAGERFVAVDLLAGRLLAVGPGGSRELLRLDVPLGAVAPHVGGGWVAAAGTGIAALDESGRLDWLARPEDDAPTPMRMNDGVADPAGRFWAGSMPYDGTPGAGSLHRVDLDGTVERVLTGLTVPNGPAFDAGGTTMYLADSARGVIDRFEVDPDTGGLGERARFAEVADASPDGMCVDVEGHLWSALWGGGRLHRYAPDGRLVEVVLVPVEQPASLSLSPLPPYTALLTSAAHGLATPARHDGRMLTAPVAVAGLPTAVCHVVLPEE